MAIPANYAGLLLVKDGRRVYNDPVAWSCDDEWPRADGRFSIALARDPAGQYNQV